MRPLTAERVPQGMTLPVQHCPRCGFDAALEDPLSGCRAIRQVLELAAVLVMVLDRELRVPSPAAASRIRSAAGWKVCRWISSFRGPAHHCRANHAAGAGHGPDRRL